MSRGTWNRIKLSKFFYVNTYRRLITLIVASQAFNVILCVAIIYIFVHKPIRTFYATSGVISPIELTPLDKPNDTGQALLPPDPVDDGDVKVIPE